MSEEKKTDVDPYELTLALHNYEVPCYMQLMTPPCPNNAQWLVYFEHIGADNCGEQPPAPMCTDHMNFIKTTLSGFWRMWFGAHLTSCPQCGVPFRVGRIDPIKKG